MFSKVSKRYELHIFLSCENLNECEQIVKITPTDIPSLAQIYDLCWFCCDTANFECRKFIFMINNTRPEIHSLRASNVNENLRIGCNDSCNIQFVKINCTESRSIVNQIDFDSLKLVQNGAFCITFHLTLHHKLAPIGGKPTLISGLTSIHGFDAVPVADFTVNFPQITYLWAGQFVKFTSLWQWHLQMWKES